MSSHLTSNVLHPAKSHAALAKHVAGLGSIFAHLTELASRAAQRVLYDVPASAKGQHRMSTAFISWSSLSARSEGYALRTDQLRRGEAEGPSAKPYSGKRPCADANPCAGKWDRSRAHRKDNASLDRSTFAEPTKLGWRTHSKYMVLELCGT